MTTKTEVKLISCDNREFADFSISAYEDSIVWRTCSDKIAPLRDTSYLCFEAPKVGEYRIVRVIRPFNESLYTTFWDLFKPPLSVQNGWYDYPEEIDESVFVKCKLEKILYQDDSHAWLQVKVLECIKLAEALDILPEVKETKPITEQMCRFDDLDIKIANGWIFYEGSSIQGDFGNWLLVKEVNGVHKLVAFCEGLPDKYAFLGNIVISNQTFNTLNQWCKNL